MMWLLPGRRGLVAQDGLDGWTAQTVQVVGVEERLGRTVDDVVGRALEEQPEVDVERDRHGERLLVDLGGEAEEVLEVARQVDEVDRVLARHDSHEVELPTLDQIHRAHDELEVLAVGSFEEVFDTSDPRVKPFYDYNFIQ